MRMRTVEISVGAFMLAGILALVFIAIRVSGINLGADEGSYTVTARFDDIAGLSIRSKVTMAGVTIGRVATIGVDTEYGEAIVGLEISGGVRLTADTGAQILTEGLIGGRYVSLIPGADEEVIEDGGEITDTQGAMVLENLIGEFVTGMGS